jgi:site-specific DNA-cytosine methylase
VQDALRPRSTHVINSKTWFSKRLRHIRKPGQTKFVYLANQSQNAPFRNVRSVNEPCFTITASGALGWARQKKHKMGMKRFTIAEAAALQTFPASYVWPPNDRIARTLVGNAVPPRAARMMLPMAAAVMNN